MCLRFLALIIAFILLPGGIGAQSLQQLRELLSVRPTEGTALQFYLTELAGQVALSTTIKELSNHTSRDDARPNDALLLALLQRELGYTDEAQGMLRTNAQRHPKDRVALAALAWACGGQEKEEALTRLYDLPAPPHQRLECLRQLAIVKQSDGRLREMRDAWAKRPKDAYGWLELGVLQRRAGEDSEWRRCVYEASRLRPKDVLLLGEIARQEAGLGFIHEALATLAAADAVEKAASTELLRCLILMETAQNAQALATLATLKLPANTDVELVRAVADKLAEKAEWSTAVRLLDQALVVHPTDYQLHYLRAVALEEQGVREAAARAFIDMLALKDETPADETPWFSRAFSGRDELRASVKGLKLPAGTLGLMHTEQLRRSAYSHQIRSCSVCIDYVYTQVEDAPSSAYLWLPQSLLDALFCAVVHLQRLLPCVAELRAEADKAMFSAGLERPDLLLHSRGMKSPALQARHPQDLALHAARLLDAEYENFLPQVVLDAQVGLFQDTFPQLAFLAACRAYHSAVALEGGLPAPAEQPGSAKARHASALKLADKASPSPQVIRALLGLRAHDDGDNDVEKARAKDMLILSHAVDLVQQMPEMNEDLADDLMTTVVETCLLNDAMPHAIRLMRALASIHASGTPAETEPTPSASMQPLKWPGIRNTWLSSLASKLYAHDLTRGMPQALMNKLHAQVAQVPEPEMRRALELCLRDYSGMEAESRLRLARPQPAVNDHLFAATMAIVTDNPIGQLQHLVAASALTKNATELRRIDKSILHAAIEYQDDRALLSGELRAAVISSLQRWRTLELHPADREATDSALLNIGTVAEVEQMKTRQNEERAIRSEQSRSIAYSQDAAYIQQEEDRKQAVERLVSAMKAKDVKASAAVARWMRDKEILDSYFSNEEIRRLLGSTAAVHLLLQASRLPTPSSEAKLLSYATSLLNLEETDAALQIYTELAERDPHACTARLHAARLLAEKDPDLALKYLRSIQVESALPDAYGTSPVNILVPERSSASRRIAIAELVTRWLDSMQAPAEWSEVFDSSICGSLISMIQSEGSEDNVKFPALNQPKDSPGYFIPTGAGASRMKQARHAHDELCRALLRLPEIQPEAMKALASLVLNEEGDLGECARLARVLLRDEKAQAALSIAEPGLTTVLVRHAAQSRDFARLEKEDLPLIEKTMGYSAAQNARLYARLFSVAEADYPAAASEWLTSRAKGENRGVRYVDEVLSVWRTRGLKASLDTVLLESPQIRAELDLGNAPDVLTNYITLLARAGRKDEAVSFAKKLRDAMSSSDAEERRKMIAEWQKQERKRISDSGLSYQRKERGETPEHPSHISRFASFLKQAMNTPDLLCLLSLGLEDGLLGRPEDLATLAYELMNSKMLRTPEAGLTFAEKLGFLSEASTWRDYVLTPDHDPHTWLSSLADKLREWPDRQDVARMVAARQPQTLGCEVFAALLSRSEEGRDVLLRKALQKRKDELNTIPQEQRRAFSLMLRKELPGYGDFSKLDADLAAALQPFRDEESDALVPELDRFLAAKEWTDVGLSVYEFPRKFTATLAQAARRHPAKVAEAVRHACELLKQTPADEEQRFVGEISNSPTGNFLRAVGKIPQVLGTSMELVEKEKLSDNLGWIPTFADQLTDYQRINNREYLEAIFSQSPLVADVAHFQDFALSLQTMGESASLLDRVIHRLNETNAQWLQQKLKAAPQQTFGTQLALALLESNAPTRKARNSTVRAKPDAAPVAAFAAAHAAEIQQLPPTTAKVVHHVIESYLNPPKPAPIVPNQKTLTGEDPFGAPSAAPPSALR